MPHRAIGYHKVISSTSVRTGRACAALGYPAQLLRQSFSVIGSGNVERTSHRHNVVGNFRGSRDIRVTMTGPGLKAIFLQERPMLVRLLVARLGSPEDAEDAIQELWLKLDGLAEEAIASKSAYLYRMATNLAADRRITAVRGSTRDLAWFQLQPDASELADAERVLLARERLRQVEQVVDAMPDNMRKAFRMFRVEGSSQKAIAAALGITLSGVEKLLQRAYRKIYDASSRFSEESSPRDRLTSMKDRET
jgi:RNA polymerase sigma factor (sigma-70 family)